MKKTPGWYYIILIIIPFVILLFLELLLHAFSYGISLDQWVEISGGKKLILNPDVGARYFTSTNNFPQSNNDAFDKIKTSNSFRIFILGGSSAAGFPYSPNGSFSRYIRDRLYLISPDKNIEVINLGITAVNTYTIADLLPGIIEQKPDMLIIYAGHNEYYGALGVGSIESIGNSPSLIKFYLYLNNFKTFQLARDLIKWGSKLISPKNDSLSGTTLMARMADDKVIGYKSDLYNKGLEQFENNLNDIFSAASNNGIKILVGTLTSNLKDLKPFISINNSEYPSAQIIYSEARNELSKNNFSNADSLFRYAKDLDGLRFRAPENFNNIIKKTALKYNAVIADIDKEFNAVSPDGIIGNNLMVDHLHPTLNGYLLLGKIFADKILDSKLFEPDSKIALTLEKQDSIVKANFAFSILDSTIAHYRILNLLNDWPFAEHKDKGLFNKILYKNKIDSLAYKVAMRNYNWEKAHQQAYEWYLLKNDVEGFSEELKVLSSQYPFRLNYVTYAAQELLKLKAYKEALYFLEKKYREEPDEFSVKWIGNINLFMGNNETAISFFEKSLEYNNKDAQIYFNLSIAHLKLKEYEKAISTIKNCISINPSYPNALSMLNQLESIIKKPR